ncbi:hypothetical protein A9Q75_05250 [Colwellia psychrerythraea]|uniref:Uncharacterized protein n=1 Tax=Colwellia psychrerythraea TaxID=28229 RepID=A0A1Y5EPY6_COLPS|nr:hypothetical protein A9Q75_05250 [Colwellia psychrerythraea]
MINSVNILDEKEIKSVLLEEEANLNVPDFCSSILDYVTYLKEEDLYRRGNKLKVWVDYFTPLVRKFQNVLTIYGLEKSFQADNIISKSKELSGCVDSICRRNFIGSLKIGSKKNSEHQFLDLQRSFLSDITALSTQLKTAIAARRTDNERFFDFYDFYTPDISDKVVTIDLLREAIVLIEQDLSISSKAKKKIINKILEIIKSLENSETKWTMTLGSIKETIIILGALGSLTGGAVGLAQATEKVKEAEEIVCSTSINNNFKIEHNSFNLVVENTIALENKEEKIIEHVEEVKEPKQP